MLPCNCPVQEGAQEANFPFRSGHVVVGGGLMSVGSHTFLSQVVASPGAVAAAESNLLLPGAAVFSPGQSLY